MENFIRLEDVKSVRVAKEEAETVINIARGDNYTTIYTSDNTIITKLLRAASKNRGDWKCWSGGTDSNGNVTGYFFRAPKRSISIRSGSKKVVELTEEQKIAKAERMRNSTKGKSGRGKRRPIQNDD